MSMQKKRVFLIITIPTHLRVMVNTAKILENSGLYEPELVFFPDAVFQQNIENCQNLKFKTWIWKNDNFVDPKILDQEIVKIEPEPLKKKFASTPKHQLNSLSSILSATNNEQSQSILNYYKFRRILIEIRNRCNSTYISCKAYDLLDKYLSPIVLLNTYLIVFYRLLRGIVAGIIYTFKTTTLPLEKKKSALRTVMSKFLTGFFSAEWNDQFFQKKIPPNTLYERLIPLYQKSEFFPELKSQKKFYTVVKKFITDEKPSLIILPEENLFYNSQYIVSAGHLNNISTLIIPFTVVNTSEWAVAFYKDKDFHVSTFLDRLFAFSFPEWTLKYKDKRLILPKVYILSCMYFNTTPSDPWLINSGKSDFIAAESKFMFDYYTKAGIDAAKIQFTGTPSDDYIFLILKDCINQRTQLSLKHAVTIKNQIVLISLPPDQFGGTQCKHCDFQNYEELIKFMIENVVNQTDSDTSVIISLHPRTDYSSVKWIESFGVTIIKEPIEKILPLSDVFIAVSSATIRLALNCNIPVVNFDAYRFDYDDFKNIPLVLDIKTKEDYIQSVKSLLLSSKKFTKCQQENINSITKSCSLDGQSTARLLNLISSVSSKS